MFEGVFESWIKITIFLFVFAILGLWKFIEIIIWLCKHIEWVS